MILIVDDERNNLLIVGKFLEHLGYEYQTANNGEEALHYFANRDFDMVLLDIQMPKMNGVDCAKAIRKMECEKCHVPIIALTAQIFREELNKYLEAGINDYLIKPFEPNELKEKLFKYGVVNQSNEVKKKTTGKPALQHQFIQLDYIQRLANGEQDFVIEMLSTIVEDVPTYMAQLEASFNQCNASGIKRIAHKLNSPLSSLGLTGLVTLDFLTNSPENEITGAKGYEALMELKKITQKVVKEINAELNSIKTN